jgi:hypothetical protein
MFKWDIGGSLLVDYCRLLIVVLEMINVKETSMSDVWNGKTAELHNMPVCIGLLYCRACQHICLFLFISNSFLTAYYEKLFKLIMHFHFLLFLKCFVSQKRMEREVVTVFSFCLSHVFPSSFIFKIPNTCLRYGWHKQETFATSRYVLLSHM